MQFPDKVWDGKSTTRQDLTCSKGPDASDWSAMTQELQSVQNYVLKLSGNLVAMPDLPKIVSELTVSLQKLESRIKDIAPPTDVVRELAEFKEHIATMDIRKRHTNLQEGVKRLFFRAKKLDTAFVALKKNLEYEQETFQNQVRNQLMRLEHQSKTRILELEEKVKELQELLETPEI